MANKKNMTKFENGKVIFSQEILEYFDSLRNEETNKWVNKYIEVLSDSSNINASKFDIHHIKPVFLFKTEELNTRRKAEKVANKFNGNMIKLSIYNHIMAHFYLWKIYDNFPTKNALNYFKTSKVIDDLTEDEMKVIAKIIEESEKTNKSRHQYYEENKDTILFNNKMKRVAKIYRLCFDPRDKNTITIVYWGTLYNWASNNRKEFNIVSPTEFTDKYLLTKKDEIKYVKEIELFKQSKIYLSKEERRHQLCLDPRYNTLNSIGEQKYYKICYWGSLNTWANNNRNLINNLTPTEFADKYLLTEEEIIVYSDDIKYFINKSRNPNKNYMTIYRKNLNNSLCLDPRYKIVKNKYSDYLMITNWESLYGWSQRYPNHWLLNNLTPKEFANKYLLSEEDKIKYAKEIEEYLNSKKK